MSAKTMSAIAEDYFYSINPLAKRIGEDVAATKDAYDGLWSTLSVEERNKAIDETIIQPEVALKYVSNGLDGSKDYPEYYPKLRIQTGMKYMYDETGLVRIYKLILVLVLMCALLKLFVFRLCGSKMNTLLHFLL